MFHVCDKVKAELTTNDEVEITYIDSCGQYSIEVPFKRVDFERIVIPYFEALLDFMNNTLGDTYPIIEVDHVILTGGSSRIPKLKELLAKGFEKKKLLIGDDETAD